MMEEIKASILQDLVDMKSEIIETLIVGNGGGSLENSISRRLTQGVKEHFEKTNKVDAFIKATLQYLELKTKQEKQDDDIRGIIDEFKEESFQEIMNENGLWLRRDGQLCDYDIDTERDFSRLMESYFDKLV